MALKLTPERLDRLRKALDESFAQVIPLRESRNTLFRTCLARWEAATKEKNFPWKGAASIHIPIVAIMLDSIKAKILNSLFAQDQVISGVPLSDEPIPGLVDPATGEPITWRWIADRAEKVLNYEISEAGDVDLKKSIEDFFDDIGILGTGVLHLCWHTEQQRDWIDDDNYTDHTVYDNVKIQVVPLEDFYLPPGYKDFNRIPWVSRRYILRPSEILHNVDSMGWNKKAVAAFLEKKDPAPLDELATGNDIDLQEATGGVYADDELEIAQTWMRFDLDGKGRETRILVDHAFHNPMHIFRVIPWPYEHGKLPFVASRYIKRRNKFFGMGLPERLAGLDDAISANMNQTMDNVTIANTRLWRVKSDSSAARAMDVIWPGKKIPSEEPGDFEGVAMGEVYPSTFEVGNILRDYTERLAKVSDYNLGRESASLGSQGTATSTLALLQESGQYFETITRDIRGAINEILQQWIDLIAQYKPMDRLRLILGQDAEIFIKAIDLPFGALRKRIAIQVAFSSTAATRELAKQEEMSKISMLQQYYTGILSLAQARFSPMLPLPVAILIDQIAVDAEQHIRRFLKTFGDSYTTSTLPSWQKAMLNVPPVPGPGFQAQQLQQQASASSGIPPVGGMGPDPGQAPDQGGGAPPGPPFGG